jgi:hypothetical protein
VEEGRLGSRGGGLQVLEDKGEVEVVPAVGDLAVPDVDEGRTGEGDGAAGGGEAEVVAGVGEGGGPADGDFVVLGDEFVEHDVNIGEGVVEIAVGGSESGWAGEGGGGVGKTEGLSFRRVEFVDGGGVALIPDFVEPTLDELFVCVAHGFPPEDRKSSTSCAGGGSGIFAGVEEGWVVAKPAASLRPSAERKGFRPGVFMARLKSCPFEVVAKVEGCSAVECC